MSAAADRVQGSPVLEQPGPPPFDARAALAALRPVPDRLELPPLPQRRSGAAQWARALHPADLPGVLLGPALVVALDRSGGALVVAALLGAAHGAGRLGADARAERPVLRRVEAQRGLLALAGVAVALAACTALVAAGPVALALPAAIAAAAVTGLPGAARRTALAAVGAAAAVVAATAVSGAAWDVTAALAVAAAGLGAGLARGTAAPDRVPAERALVLVPYLAVGAAVGAGVLALPALAVAVALPAARRAARAVRPGPVVAGHARLLALALLVGLAV